MTKPLSGIKIIELGSIGPGPYAGQILSDLGAEVICVERPGNAVIAGADAMPIERRGKKSIVIDIRKQAGAELVLKLVKHADVIFEGNRPGVTERLGIGPEACQKVNPKIVYGRITGWGQSGPWSKIAGHDINYISVTGALEAMGQRDLPPPPPLNLLGDYGGGSMNLVTGILAGLIKAQKTGRGEVIDAAIVDGVSSMMGIVHGLDYQKLWQNEREANLLDGAAPFYRCYQTRDKKFIAVGCIEPQFFKIFLSTLELEPKDIGPQYDRQYWPAQIERFTDIFTEKTRDEWAEIFDGTDACVTPVLSYKEAVNHKHLSDRNVLRLEQNCIHPKSVPTFLSSNNPTSYVFPQKGEQTHEILENLGLSSSEISELKVKHVIA